MVESRTVIGLISGTSMDGIDVAVGQFQLDGEVVRLRPLGHTSVPYSRSLRGKLESVLPPSETTIAAICQLDTAVGQAFAEAAEVALSDIAPKADLVVSHGQTVFHWVEDGEVRGSLQIGQPAWIAERTGLPVVSDLRVADIAAGGQGAPLAALFDVLLLSGSDRRRISLNLGGISNITVVDGKHPTAYDVGPANALIDAAVQYITGGKAAFDADGAMAARGRVHERLLDKLLEEPYYDLPPPKTTGKELFHLPYLLQAVSQVGEVEDEDLVATATALAAVTVSEACKSHQADEVIAAGGGVYNPTLMQMLDRELGEIQLRTIDELGVPSAAKESYFIALLGYLTIHGLPGNLPSATGASRPVVMGSHIPGRSGFQLAESPRLAPKRLEIDTSRNQ